MNIVIQPSQFNTNYVFLLEKKENIVFDGIFTKILFSNELFTMNGIYLKFQLEPMKMGDAANKHVLCFQPYNKNNLQNIQQISNMEIDILEHYQKMNQSNNYINNVLSKTLYTGAIKLFNTGSSTAPGGKASSENVCKLCIKISGIWETVDEIGITYKVYRI